MTCIQQFEVSWCILKTRTVEKINLVFTVDELTFISLLVVSFFNWIKNNGKYSDHITEKSTLHCGIVSFIYRQKFKRRRNIYKTFLILKKKKLFCETWQKWKLIWIVEIIPLCNHKKMWAQPGFDWLVSYICWGGEHTAYSTPSRYVGMNFD